MARHLPDELKAKWDAMGFDPSLTPNQLMLAVARSCIGVKESSDNSGDMIDLFQSTISSPLKQSWCLDFVQSCIAYVELAKGVQSPLAATELCMGLWAQSIENRVTDPEPGDIVIWQLGNTEHGHTGLVDHIDATHLYTIEGNTSDSLNIDRNGDGVYEKYRLKGGSVTFRQMGFLRAF